MKRDAPVMANRTAAILRQLFLHGVHRTRATAGSMSRFQMFGISPFSPHDLRRSCRTGLMRIGVRRFIGRRILNHKQLGVDGIYDLHDYFKQNKKRFGHSTSLHQV